jgi:CHC2 zinc finger
MWLPMGNAIHRCPWATGLPVAEIELHAAQVGLTPGRRLMYVWPLQGGKRSLCARHYGFLFSVPHKIAAEAWVPGIDFRAVRAQISMTQVLALIGFEPQTASGPALRGPCPIHHSQTPRSRSFAVQLERKVYHCFRCGGGGNHLDLYAAVTQQDLYHAALDLCAKLQLPIPWLKAPG